MTMTVEWVDRARQVAPSAGHAELLGQGQLSVAVAVDEHVVRFPRHQLGVEQIRTERGLVPQLRAIDQVNLPTPEHADLTLPIGQAFAVHRLVPGQILTPGLWDALPDNDRTRLIDQLSSFLTGLAAIGPGDTGVPTRPLSELAQQMADDVARLLAPRMSSVARRRATRELTDLAGIERSEPATVCHTDLGGNLVWDAVQHTLGVIDFGGAVMSDPVLDLASLTVLGAAVAARVADRTPHLAGRLDDAQVIRRTFALQDALLSAKQERWPDVAAVLDTY